MSEIGTLSLERLNNGAHFLFVSNVLARAEADTNIKSKLSTQIASLKSAKEQEDEDLKISQKSLLTDDIAAAAIDPKMQLDKETGLLINFVDDLEKKFANEVETLSLGAFVTALKAANEKVRTLTASRTDERMSKAVGALKVSRKASDEAYRLLVKFVNAYALIEGDAKFLNFIDYVNTEIVHYKREVIGQKTDAAQTSGTTGGTTSGGGSSTGGFWGEQICKKWTSLLRYANMPILSALYQVFYLNLLLH